MEKDTGMQGRRAASRATKLRRRKTRMNFILLAGFAALIVLLVLVTPKEPVRRATYSAATESGLVEENGNEQPGAYAGLVISEVMSSNNTAVTDENGKYAWKRTAGSSFSATTPTSPARTAPSTPNSSSAVSARRSTRMIPTPI